jgi:hypothetical protein
LSQAQPRACAGFSALCRAAARRDRRLFFTRDHEPRAGISPFAPVGNGLQSGRNWALIAKSSVLLQRRAPLIDLQWNRAALPPFVTREMKSL